MYQFAKHFTLAEAQAMIAGLREVFRTVHMRVKEAAELNENTAPAPASTRSGNGNGNGNHDHKSKGELVEEAEALLRQVQEAGIVIQDWRRGLIDFPHLKDGREVFLCYELADGDTIEYYHELDAGYAGRESLE